MKTIQDAFNEASLTTREQTVVWSIARGESMTQAAEQIGGVCKARAWQLAKEAGRKLGLKMSLVQALQEQRKRGKAYADDDAMSHLGACWTAEDMSDAALRAAVKRARRPLTVEEKRWRTWSRQARRLTGMI